MKILKCIVILALPFLLSNCAKEETDPSGLQKDIVGHWQTDVARFKTTYNYSFTKEGKFAYWEFYTYENGKISNTSRDLTGDWTVFSEDKIGLTFQRSDGGTGNDIITVNVVSKNTAEILDFSDDVRLYQKQ